MLLLLNVTKNSVVIGYHVFLLKVLCLKPKPQIDGFFPRILHILGQENIFHGDAGYYRLLLSEATMQLKRNHVTTWYSCEWLL